MIFKSQDLRGNTLYQNESDSRHKFQTCHGCSRCIRVLSGFWVRNNNLYIVTNTPAMTGEIYEDIQIIFVTV